MLLVGVDLCDDVTQMTCYHAGTEEIVSIGRNIRGERVYEWPTVLAFDRKSGSWFFGVEAMEQSEEENVYLFPHLVQGAAAQEKITGTCPAWDGEKITIDAPEALMRFFVKALSCLKEYFPSDTIRKLVITVEDKTEELEQVIRQALEKIGLGNDRVIVQQHRQSYMYYALCQKKELWMNDVGMFEFGPKGLFYSQIHIDRRTSPYIVGVKQKDLSNILNWDMMEHDSSFKMDYAFVNLANTQLHKQMVTTIYVTGPGFQGDWAQEALKQLCAGRRVFRGQNLFTKGACYAARELAGIGKMEKCLFLDEDMTYCNISMRVYHDAKMEEFMLAKAGSSWRQIDKSIDVIPEDEEEIQLTIQNVLRHETKVHLLSLEGFADRPDKMTRFTVRIRFSDASHCIVTLKDNGFGEFFPSSNRIWETKLAL